MSKSMKKKIEMLHSLGKEEEILNLLDSLPKWGKEEYREYASILNILERYQEALEFLFKEEGKDEENGVWNYQVSYAYFFLQNWKESLFYAKKALSLRAEKEDKIRYFIMESCASLNETDVLISFLEENALPNDAEWNAYFGSAYLEKEEVEKAIIHLKKAIEIFKKEKNEIEIEALSKLLAQIYFQYGKTEEYEEIKKKYGFSDSFFDITDYSFEDEDLILAHIERYFGKIERRIHDFNPEFIGVDILVIPPSTKHPYTTLMTLGMGSRFMEGTPPELIPEGFGYDELFLCLPDDWEFSTENLWPIQYLFDLAKFPFQNQSWIGAGHSLAYDSYIGDTNFSGFLITYPYEHGMEAFQFYLEEDLVIHFYNIIPLYIEELNYKQEIGFEELETLFQEIPMVTNIHRPNVALYHENVSQDNEEIGEDSDSQHILYQ